MRNAFWKMTRGELIAYIIDLEGEVSMCKVCAREPHEQFPCEECE